MVISQSNSFEPLCQCDAPALLNYYRIRIADRDISIGLTSAAIVSHYTRLTTVYID